MFKPLFCNCVLIFSLLINTFPGYSQEVQSTVYKPLTRILFIFDASQSMTSTWGDTEKIITARKVLIDIVDSLEQEKNVVMALRVYGHQSPVPPQDCSDTKLEVPFSPGNASRIRQKLRFITPKGTTPIAGSLAQAINDFPDCPECRNIIILITDGIEACDGDPCAISLELQKKGIILKPFVVGIGLDPGFRETFDCVGYYYDVQDEINFREAIGIVITQVLNETTSQVNLLDERGYPTETNVNMTFHDQVSGKIRYNLMHTINHRGNPDTLYIDHLTKYRLVVHTLPPLAKDSISITSGKHNIISLNAAQGYLNVKTTSVKAYENITLTVRKTKEMQTLTNQKIGETVKLLIGKYDIEVPVIPRLYINDIQILQSHTTIVEIPSPGTVTFSGPANGYGSIYQIDKDRQTWIYNLSPAVRSQTILMQPGNYRLVFRSVAAKSSGFTVTKNFAVDPDKKITVDLF